MHPINYSCTREFVGFYLSCEMHQSSSASNRRGICFGQRHVKKKYGARFSPRISLGGVLEHAVHHHRRVEPRATLRNHWFHISKIYTTSKIQLVLIFFSYEKMQMNLVCVCVCGVCVSRHLFASLCQPIVIIIFIYHLVNFEMLH